jgi:hypothetical protein
MQGVAGKCGFELITPKRQYLLWSRTEEDKARWCEVPPEY